MFILENSGVYKIISKRDGKYYPGSSKHLLAQVGNHGRKYEHFYHLRKGEHHCRHLQYAYNKYGENNFIFVIIKNHIPENQLLIEEQKLLDIAKTEPKMCYSKNYVAGKVEMTPEVRKKISIANTGRQTFLGRHHTQEAKEKLRLFNIGKKLSQEVKDKISQAKKGQLMGELNPNFGNKLSEKQTHRQSEIWKEKYKNGYVSPRIGRKHSYETITKMQKSHKNQDMSFCWKPVKQINKDTGEVIREWESITQAAQTFSNPLSAQTCIGSVCRKSQGKAGRINKTAYGFKWEFV